MKIALPVLAASVALAVAACGEGTSTRVVPGGDPDRGARLIEQFGCGSCHHIPGIARAGGRVGPSLDHLEGKRLIAGELPNSTANAIRWIENPRRIEPGTIMPDLGVTEQQARDIVAYLYRH
jgi:cytochrome c2